MAEEIEKNIKDMLNGYNKKLSSFSQDGIDSALSYLNHCRNEIWEKERNDINENFSIRLEDLSGETKDIFKLMEQLKKDIKQLYVNNNGVLTHITTVAPEDMEDGRIKKSIGRLNNYETEKGDWTFASSEAIDGRNAYMARQKGMILIAENVYIYGGDIISVQSDEDGSKHAVLKRPNYIYEINPKKFVPVVTLKSDRNGTTGFEFSEEWISDEDIDIDDPEQVSGVKEVTDVTDLLSNYHVFTDTKRYEDGERLIGNIIRSYKAKEDREELLVEFLQSDDLKYINGECGINVDDRFLIKHQMNISDETAREFASEPDVQLEKEGAKEIIDYFARDNTREESSNVRC